MEQELDFTALENLGVTDVMLTDIKKTVKELKEKNPSIKAIFPLVVQGDPTFDDKELYVGYFRQPDFKIFSKYLVASAQNQAGAMRQLAHDTFLAGDKELIDDDSLFLFGLTGQLSKIIATRNGALVNLSKTGK